MTINRNNLSRRETLMGIALCGATAATPLVGASIARAMHTDRSAWDAAVIRYKNATVALARDSDAVEAAHRKGLAACPLDDEFFKRYGMGHGWDIERNFRAAHMSLVIERGKGRTLSPEEARQTAADAQSAVDKFEAYQARHAEAFAEYDRRQTRFDELVEEDFAAFTDMIKTPAPDSDALLYKIEALATRLTAWESEDATSIIALRADGRRLLTTGRA